MRQLLKGGMVYNHSGFEKLDILIQDDTIHDIGVSVSSSGVDIVFNLNNFYIIPGFVDVHVHLREPGYFYKETIASGTLAAARGGYTAVCSMPNLNPPPDCLENLNLQLNIIKKAAHIKVYPYASITKGQLGRGELTDFASLAEKAVAFSDDGKGVQSTELMEKAMTQAARLGKIIAAHCEDESLLSGGYIHDGKYAAEHGHRGISSESEWKQLERDLKLAEKTGCKYHVCHISTKESVELIRKAKADGVNVTCETAPHYLVLCDEDLQEDGRFKMNPPIRSREDRAVLIKGLQDGTIDMIATDHAPHSKEEKSKGLEKSLMGVVGLETAFPILYTKLVKNNIITLEKLIELMATAPRKVFGLEGGIKIGGKADLAVLDLDSEYTIEPESFLSLGRSTPFAGVKVEGENIMTIVNGRNVWLKNLQEK